MMKFIGVLAVCILCVHSVFGRTCFTSDLQALRNGNRDGLNPTSHDCDTYLRGILRMQGIYRELPRGIDYSCYTLAVDGDEPLGQIYLYGCIPKGGCPMMKNVFMSLIRGNSVTSNRVHGAECTECGTTECNAAKGGSRRETRSIVEERYSQAAVQRAVSMTLAATNYFV